MQSHGQLQANSTATLRVGLEGLEGSSSLSKISVSQRGIYQGQSVGDVVETGSLTFHTDPADTVTTYPWQGDRIWPSSELPSADAATSVHAAAARGSDMQVGRELCSNPPLTHRINGTTPLMVSAARGNAASVRRLLLAGSNPNEHTSRMHSPVREAGVTALICACSCKGAEGVACVEVLLHSGARIDAQDATGLTALHHAVMANNRDIVEGLLRSGADASVVDKQGRAQSESSASWLHRPPVMSFQKRGLRGDLSVICSSTATLSSSMHWAKLS
jgi:ankyrin repeat protein